MKMRKKTRTADEEKNIYVSLDLIGNIRDFEVKKTKRKQE